MENNRESFYIQCFVFICIHARIQVFSGQKRNAFQCLRRIFFFLILRQCFGVIDQLFQLCRRQRVFECLQFFAHCLFFFHSQTFFRRQDQQRCMRIIQQILFYQFFKIAALQVLSQELECLAAFNMQQRFLIIIEPAF